ncbi:hypothetical protein LJ737_08120 [Hymenobacter sp. 15J16-1T3B]|uniref:hypothetical protein n=1 Tax=Hymenobacter sp. 15J16-1T3B TaxID=2886941 RepID=UPI001D103AB6|nr:hypothetical protein [Hymenobacter sp. 15J16-1T3B]MCC3157200.1 hypothetical protein [Hymenobacter sp. 15J16-1T3B]
MTLLARPAPAAEAARILALLQQVKDTVTIACMNLLLLVPIAWPGLVLYALRWRLTKRGASPFGSLLLWLLTLLHEALCVKLFTGNEHDPDMAGMLPYEYGYLLGVLLAVGGLVATLLAPATAADPAESAP